MLKVTNLSKTYGTGEGATQAIADLSFEVDPGELVCIVGPSGCGKTTLLKTMSGLLPATSGTVELDGEAVTAPPEQMALVFQDYSRSLFPWMTVATNVEFPLRRKSMSKGERRQAVEQALDSVGLDGLRRQVPVAALRRHAAARRDRPRPGLPAGDPADGRAVRLRRRADARRPRGPRPARSGTTTA